MGIFSRGKQETTQAPTEALVQRASLADLLGQGGWVKSDGSIYAVGELTALSIPAFFRAVSLKAGTIATMPLHAYDSGGKLEQQPLLLLQPDPAEDRVTTLTQLLTSLILKGNAFAILGDFDELGFPRVIKPVHPDTVTWDLDHNVYRIGNEFYDSSMILHIKGITLAGERFGMGCVEQCRRALDHAIRVEEYGRRYFSDNATPSAVIKVARANTSREDLQALKAQWIAAQRGNREPVVLPPDVDFAPLSITNEESQFLQTRIQTLTDIANIVGVPGYFIGAQGSSNTYSNVEQEGLNLLKYYLALELAAIERAFTSLLPEGITAKFNVDALLRVDSYQRAQTLQISMQWRTINEIRALENLPPVEGGDKLAGTATTPIGDNTPIQ